MVQEVDTKSRFMALVEPELNTGCLLWTGRPATSGYGQIRIGNRQKRQTHRFAYEAFVGPIPPGMQILHRCDTKLCCNPQHLRVGTQKDNIADMYAKGRAHIAITRGEAQPRAKLTEGDVAIIRAARGVVRQVDLAARFGVSQVLISKVQRGEIWTHVT